MRRQPWCPLLAGLFLLFWSAGAAVAEISFNPDTMMRTSEVKEGMKGVCKTVLQGTKIEQFGVEILGVLENQWYGGDIILFRMTDGPLVEKELGILSGMSGSPVYVDGKLIGAVSLGFASFMKEPMGGVTPIEQMLESSPKSGTPAQGPVALGKPLQVAGKTFRRVEVAANWGEDSRAGKDVLTLRPVLTPLLISGVRPERLPEWDKWLRNYGFRALPGSGAMPDGPEVELEAGSALGVELTSGDISITGVGTVTYREGNDILAFGHSMDQMGSVAIPICTAYVQGVIASIADPFKLASPIRTVGSLSQDRVWAIGGVVGQIPPRIPMTMHARNTSKGLERNYHVLVTKEQTYTMMALYEVCDEALLSISDMFGDQATTVTTRVKPEGMDAIEVTDFLSTSKSGGAYFSMPVWWAASNALGSILSMMQDNPYRKVGIDEVSLDVEMVDQSKVAEIEKVQLDRIQYRPGDEVTLHVTVQPWQGERQHKDVSFTLPSNIASGPVEIMVSGGAYAYGADDPSLLQPTYNDLPGMIKAWLTRHMQGDELLVTTSYQASGLSSPEGLLHFIPAHVTNLLYRTGKAEATPGREWKRQIVPTDWYLSGDVYLAITVEKEKWGPPQGGAPGGMPPGPGGASPSQKAPPGAEGYWEEPSSPASPTVAYPTFGWQRADRQRSAGVAGKRSQPLSRGSFNPSVEAPAASGGMVSGFTRPAGRRAEPANGMPPYPWEGAGAPPPEVMKQMHSMEGQGKPPGAEAEPGQEGEEEKPGEELVGRQPTLAGWGGATAFSTFKLNGTYPSEDGRILAMPGIAKMADIPEGTAWCVAADAAGNVYVGTGPKGRIYQFSPAGEQLKVIETGQLMVNSLAVSAEGRVFAGTSPGAKIFAVTASGEAELFCDLPDEHVWALRFDKDGNLLAGAGGEEAVLYSIAANGSSSVVYKPEDCLHVICISLDEEGQIYLGTAEPGRVILLDKERKPHTLYEAGPESMTQEVAAVGKWGDSVVFSTPDPGLFRINGEGALEALTPPAQGVAGEEASSDPGGGGQPPSVTAIATCCGKGLLMTSADATGDVWLLSGETNLARLVSFYGSQLTGAFVSGGNAYFCGNNPVAAYVMQPREGTVASATSPPFDAGRFARWGRAFWRANVPAGCSVELTSRSGDTPSPDATWSGWSFVQVLSLGRTISSPPARYIQFKVQLAGGETGDMPGLDGLYFFFLPANQKPQLQITEPAKAAFWSGSKTVTWSATDPENDKLTYSIYLSADGGQNWEELTKDISDSSYDWDTTGHDAGAYLLKVVASDHRSNPDDPKQMEAKSPVVYLDNTPPVVLLSRSKGTLTESTYSYEGVAFDNQTNITAVEYRLDEGEWQAAVAVDGIFDSKREKFKFEIDEAPAGKHKLEIAAVDQAMNRKSVTAEMEGPAESPPEAEQGHKGAEEGTEGMPPEGPREGPPAQQGGQTEKHTKGGGRAPETPSGAALSF